MVPRAGDKIDGEVESSTAACVIDYEAPQSAAAAETEITEPTAVDDSSNVNR